MHRLVVFAVPVFALLMACEFVWGWLRRRNTYRLADSISSLSQGLLSQAVAVCTQLFQIGLYTMVFALVAPWVARGSMPAFWDSAAGWIVAVLLFDFCDYWLHRAGHECAVFWAAHSVHHQSQDFNLSTALRQESTVALLGWPFYLPMALLGVPPELFGIAGLIVLIYQFWIHTEHIGKLGWFDRVFSSPSNHRVHHAVNDEYLDRNYGGMLVVWDRMFGTFAEERAPCVYGTRKPLDSWSPLRAIFGPYVPLLRDAWHTRRWRDKLRVCLRAPGWRPADVAARFPDEGPAFALDAVQRFDPPLSAAQQWSAAAQFALWTAATLIFLWQADDLSFGTDALVLGLVAAGLWVTGAVMASTLRLRSAWVAQTALLAAAAGLLIGAGNETCTRTVSRCFPITFFVGLASEDLNCSLVFRPRQQIRPKSSTDVQRAALSTPDPRSVHRRRQLPRTHHPRPVVCPASITAKTIRQMVLVMAQLGCHLGTPAPQLTGDLLVKLL